MLERLRNLQLKTAIAIIAIACLCACATPTVETTRTDKSIANHPIAQKFKEDLLEELIAKEIARYRQFTDQELRDYFRLFQIFKGLLTEEERKAALDLCFTNQNKQTAKLWYSLYSPAIIHVETELIRRRLWEDIQRIKEEIRRSDLLKESDEKCRQ